MTHFALVFVFNVFILLYLPIYDDVDGILKVYTYIIPTAALHYRVTSRNRCKLHAAKCTEAVR